MADPERSSGITTADLLSKGIDIWTSTEHTHTGYSAAIKTIDDQNEVRAGLPGINTELYVRHRMDPRGETARQMEAGLLKNPYKETGLGVRYEEQRGDRLTETFAGVGRDRQLTAGIRIEKTETHGDWNVTTSAELAARAGPKARDIRGSAALEAGRNLDIPGTEGAYFESGVRLTATAGRQLESRVAGYAKLDVRMTGNQPGDDLLSKATSNLSAVVETAFSTGTGGPQGKVSAHVMKSVSIEGIPAGRIGPGIVYDTETGHAAPSITFKAAF